MRPNETGLIINVTEHHKNSLSPSRFKLFGVSMNFIVRTLAAEKEGRQKINVEKESCIRKYAGNFYRNL